MSHRWNFSLTSNLEFGKCDGPVFELLFKKNYGLASTTQLKIFGLKVILPTTPSILETILSSFGPFFDLESPTENIPKTGPRKVTLLQLCGGTKSDFPFVDS